MHRCQLFCHNHRIYLNEYKQVEKHLLFYGGGPCRIETSPLICSRNQWFVLYMIGTSVMKNSRRSFPIIHRNSVLTCCKAEFTFSLSGFSFHEYSRFMGQQENGMAISLYPFYHFHPLHRRLDINRFIAEESSCPRIAGCRIQIKNL